MTRYKKLTELKVIYLSRKSLFRCLQSYQEERFSNFLFGLDLLYLFNGIATCYGLFNAKIWFIFKWLIIIITTYIFSIPLQSLFLITLFYLSIITICLDKYQVFLLNSNNLLTVIKFHIQF